MNEIKFVNILGVSDELKEKVRQWRNAEEIRKAMQTQHIITKEEHSKWIESLKRRKDRKAWVVFIENNPAGSINLQNMKHKELNSEWGYYIGDSAYKGIGLGKCILFKFLEMFFEEIEFKTLVTKVLSNNVIALNLYKKFKFKKIDRLPFKNGEETLLFEFSKENWIKSKNELRNECYYKNKR